MHLLAEIWSAGSTNRLALIDLAGNIDRLRAANANSPKPRARCAQWFILLPSMHARCLTAQRTGDFHKYTRIAGGTIVTAIVNSMGLVDSVPAFIAVSAILRVVAHVRRLAARSNVRARTVRQFSEIGRLRLRPSPCAGRCLSARILAGKALITSFSQEGESA